MTDTDGVSPLGDRLPNAHLRIPASQNAEHPATSVATISITTRMSTLIQENRWVADLTWVGEYIETLPEMQADF